jgi:hypothetical protein
MEARLDVPTGRFDVRTGWRTAAAEAEAPAAIVQLAVTIAAATKT